MKHTASKLYTALAVYLGCRFIGSILEYEDGTRERPSTDGKFIGSYRSRQEAARALPAPTR